MPSVGFDVATERRDFVQATLPVQDTDRAEADPHRHGTGEQPQDFLRFRGSGDVVVHVRIAEERIPDRSTDAPRLEPGALEYAGNVQHLLGDLDPFHAGSPDA